MLLKSNFLESLTFISCIGTLICVLLNYVTNISPFKGLWFPAYLVSLFFVSLMLSFKFIQWLIHLNKPLTYDVEGLVQKYPFLGFLSDVLPKRPRDENVDEFKEYDTNELSVISTVLERKLVSSWYVPFVSQDIGFPFACKQLLDQIIGKTFQICSKIETKDVYVDVCSILITHLKEYKKALKRHEKSQNTTIESHYKKTHPISVNTKYSTADHCTNILRVILKDLVPWELWDTPHSELLIRILAKRLDNFIEIALANPVWLNDKLLSLLEKKSTNKETVEETIKPQENITNTESETTKKELDVKESREFEEPKKLNKETDPQPEKSTVEQISTNKSPAASPKPLNNLDVPVNGEKALEIEELELPKTEPVDIKTSPVLRQRRGRQGRNEVKIYDRIIEGSVKTWETDIDLQCISLGQDLLASLDGEITLSRLWGQEHETEKNQPLWFGEEEALEMDLQDSKEPSPVKKEHSPKPAELLKDLQTTVHQAKTKIGDLQVPKHEIDVPRNNDEAAGMMEGLLDFGIAGFKKGLRLTGLSDDSDKSPSNPREKERSLLEKGQDRIHEMNIAASAARDETNSSVPQLVKQQRIASQDSIMQQRIASQDSMASHPVAIPKADIPPPLIPLSDSPEPEYEEAADLSTSIAKLRSLLQQRAETSPNRSEDIWWESAEETRGRTHHHRSSKPVDTATLADEYDMNADRNISPNQTSNNMQRLDKLFHRTVTGVFNSLKTAVGAEGDEGAACDVIHHQWTYVYTSMETSVSGLVSRAVGSRRLFGHVDAALDSLTHIPPSRDKPPHTPEDFEEWCQALGLYWCACAEVGCAAGLCTSHLAYRLVTILVADLAESLINSKLSTVGSELRAQVFAAFEKMQRDDDCASAQELRKYDIDETHKAVMDRVAGTIAPYMFGEEVLSSSTRLVLNSLSHRDLNKDIVCRILDVIATHFQKAAGIRNPSFDAN